MPSPQVAYTNLPARIPTPTNSPPKANYINSTTITTQSIDAQILYELRQLNRIQAELASEAPLRSQAIWSFVLQVLAILIGALFGVFAILAWKAADQANTMSYAANSLASRANYLASTANVHARVANQLALAEYCQSATDGLCSSVQAAAATSVEYYAYALYSVTAPPSVTVTYTSSSYLYSTTVIRSGTRTVTSSFPTATSLIVVTRTTQVPSSTESSAGPTRTVGNATGDAGPSKAGPIAGIVVAAIAGLAIFAAAAWSQFLVYKRRVLKSQRIQELARGYDEKVE